MSKGDYPYPEDEFDRRTRSAGRGGGPREFVPRGVHRAPRSPWHRVWPFLVTIVVVPVLAYAGVTYLADSDRLELPGSDQSAPVESPGPDATAEAPATPAPEETTPEATTAPPAGPVQSTAVTVLNGTGRSGLAATKANALKAAGWTAVTPDNYKGTRTTSVVLYATPELQVTAQAVADALGVATIEQSDDAKGAIVVALLKDYKD